MQHLLNKMYTVFLLIIFGGVVFHAPLSVWLGVHFPAWELVFKAWKEVLIVLLVPLAVYLVWRRGLFNELRHDKLLLLIFGYILLHIIAAMIFRLEVLPLISGLMIDLRYVVFFSQVYIAIRLTPHAVRYFIGVGVITALLSLSFALLQVAVLPPDFLAILGYGKNTIASHMYVDNNPAYVRINGTFRGPNPLGAYALIVVSLLGAYVFKAKAWLGEKRRTAAILLLGVGGLSALWASYSRSALVGTGIAVVIIGLVVAGRRIPMKMWGSALVVATLVVGGSLFALKDSYFVSHVIFHNDPNGGGVVTSDEQHVESLQTGAARLISQPLGAGPGSTGSASLYGDNPLIIENQYLFVAHEVGWLGLGLFVAIFGLILLRLWRAPKTWLSIGVLASGVGIAAVGLLQPVWADDTVSLVWWGLAAVALATPRLTITRRQE